METFLAQRQLSDAPLIVLGMHRSGTTLLARILDAAGVYMGSRLSGNHEPRLFQDTNRQVLDFFGCSWCRLEGLPPASALALGYGNLVRAMSERLIQDMDHGFLDARATAGANWGWKDPRNCLTAPQYLRLFPKARALFVFRRARSVVNSLLVRNRRLLEKGPLSAGSTADVPGAFDASSAYSLWNLYNTRALEALPGFAQIGVLCYEDLVASPDREIARVLDELRIDSPLPLDELAAMVRRSAPTPAGEREDDAEEEPRPAVDAYRSLRARARGESSYRSHGGTP